ncbi:MAG: amidohydrolase family protein, partial [Clostridia bacterium]|nr:amidohydrolase family protein [Clostridia bacterium]
MEKKCMAEFIGMTEKEKSVAMQFLSQAALCDISPSYVVFPGFCDVHVHFREPGFSYKETIYDGCCAAARGGYTAVCTMPNLNPVPDSAEH